MESLERYRILVASETSEVNGLIPGLLLVPILCSGDLYKYLDTDGKLYFIGALLEDRKYQQNRNKSIILRRRHSVPSNKLSALSVGPQLAMAER